MHSALSYTEFTLQTLTIGDKFLRWLFTLFGVHKHSQDCHKTFKVKKRCSTLYISQKIIFCSLYFGTLVKGKQNFGLADDFGKNSIWIPNFAFSFNIITLEHTVHCIRIKGSKHLLVTPESNKLQMVKDSCGIIVFSHEVSADMLVSQNKVAAAMLI